MAMTFTDRNHKLYEPSWIGIIYLIFLQCNTIRWSTEDAEPK